MILLGLFVLLQAADGLLTYAGIQRWGLGAEGNPLIVALITHVGVVPALVLAKLVTAAAGVFLYERGRTKALAWLTIFYVLVVVGPWALVWLETL